jgi:hypothetical protein
MAFSPLHYKLSYSPPPFRNSCHPSSLFPSFLIPNSYSLPLLSISSPPSVPSHLKKGPKGKPKPTTSKYSFRPLSLTLFPASLSLHPSSKYQVSKHCNKSLTAQAAVELNSINITQSTILLSQLNLINLIYPQSTSLRFKIKKSNQNH